MTTPFGAEPGEQGKLPHNFDKHGWCSYCGMYPDDLGAEDGCKENVLESYQPKDRK